MSSPPLVSVVMAVYDAERYLGEAVESILDQTFRDFEFIIINDGSVDGTTSILRLYERIDDRVFVHHQENRGLTEALNRGCRLARGKYIARMDADDVSIRDRLLKQVDFLEHHPNVAVLGGAFELMNGNGSSRRTLRVPLEDREIKEALSRYNCIPHPTIMMRKQSYDAVEGYRSPFLHAEDYDLWLRMAEHDELASLPDVVLRYRVHPGQISVMNIRQQALSILGAQVAARMRQDTGHDPFSDATQVNGDMLASCGVNGEVITTATVDAYLQRADVMLGAGYYPHAGPLLREAVAISRTKASRRRIAATYVACASGQYRAGDPVGAMAPLARAAALQPTMVPTIIRQAWSALRRESDSRSSRKIL